MPIRYIPFFPQSIEGQALLDNFVRTRRILKYRDNEQITTRILRGMPLYETQLIETIGNPTPNQPAPNLVLRGECIAACAFLKQQGTLVDLVYIDPPFASGADYAKKIYLRQHPLASDTTTADPDLELDELKAFEEKMYGDIWNKEDYLNWMYENLLAIKSIMSPNASIYVHLDWHIGHYVKILLDEIFGEDNFVNEIIWQKLKAAKGQSNSFGNVHDMIYCYCMDYDNFTHNKQYVPHSQERIKQHYNNYDEITKKYYSLDSFTQTGQGEPRDFGEYGILAPPSGKHWIWTQEKINEGLKNGMIVFTSGGKPRVKRYLDDSNGIAVGDIWTDINPINSQAEESNDYATQKPEALLERIIQASSNEGMVVADFFGGSGVTSAVAARLGRRFIHVDVGINSIQTVRDRLLGQAVSGFEIHEIKDGVTLYRNPQQTMDNLHRFIDGLRNEDNLPSFWEGAIHDSKEGSIPVYLPNLLDHSTKVLGIAQMSRIINEAMPELPEGIKKVIVYYVDIDDEAELQKYINTQNQTLITIELRDLKPLLEQAITPDVAEWTIEQTNEGSYLLRINKFLSDRLQNSIANYNLKRQMNLLQKGKIKNGNNNEPNEAEINGDAPQIKKGKFVPIDISNDGLELIEMVALDCTNAQGVWQSSIEIKIDKNNFIIVNGKKTKEAWGGSISSSSKPLRLKIRNIAGDETIWVI